MPTSLWILGALLLLAAGVASGWLLNARTGRSGTRTARHRAEEMIASARREGERASAELREAFESERETRLQQDEELRTSLEARRREREKGLARREKALADRERGLGRRRKKVRQSEARMEAQREAFEERERGLEEAERDLALRRERLAGITREEARRQILSQLRTEVRFEAAAEIKAIKEEAQGRAEEEARMIMALAVERQASDFSNERTVSYVALPDTSYKGRIIGAEGKNIRAFEKETGMQLVVDDNPDQVTISGFHPVRREIARRSLERLIKEGNIYPKKIASVVASARRKLEDEMRHAGEEAVEEFKLKKVHPEMVALLGRLRFRTSYSQNVLEHVKECAHLCGIMAAELGLDQKLAQRAALFHDIGKAVDYEREGTHPEIGAEIASRLKEPPVVVNAIASHHEDCEVISPISVLVAAADALSGARPGARRRAAVDYIQRIEKLEELAQSFEGVGSCYALRAGREVRVICSNGALDDARAALLATDLAKRIEAEMDYPGKIKVTVIRESRAVDYAR